MPEKFVFHSERVAPPVVSLEVKNIVDIYVSSDWNRFELAVKRILRELKLSKSDEWISDLEIAERILAGKLNDNDVDQKVYILEKMTIAVEVVRDRIESQMMEAEGLQREDKARAGLNLEEE